MPFITVAIPTYRRLPLLRRAVESVFAQTFTDWEVVVSDDEAPPRETWNFLEALARSDRRVRAIMNGNPHGASFNHTSALEAARGEWIKILHDDDILKPNCLEILARSSIRNTGLAGLDAKPLKDPARKSSNSRT
jgi:glycosyltransferase involved in cell wall biosynthesis